MKEVIRRCLACAGQMQEAGIPCEMVASSGGKTGECPGCHKRKLCFNWKVERGPRAAGGVGPYGETAADQ